jgi:hypothetical protein
MENGDRIGAPQVRLFPNPASDEILLSFDYQEKTEAIISIYDAVGGIRHTQSHAMNEGKNVIPFNLTGYANGVYLMLIKSQTGKVERKFVVVR